MNRMPPSDQPAGWIGRPIRRTEDERLIRGLGQYVGDICPHGCLHLAFVRSPYGHADIVSLDAATARAMPGVAAVLTGADAAHLGKAAVNSLIEGMTPRSFSPLAGLRVEAVGQPVAAVAADTAQRARDAAEAVLVKYDGADSEPLHGEAFRQEQRLGDPDACFARADHVVRVELAYERLAAMSLEPRAALGEWDPDGQRLTMHLSTQTPYRARADLAAILDLDEQSIRIIAPDVGGAFGLKASIFPEDVVVALAARKLARPVRWCASRSEDFLAGTHGRGASLKGALALDATGRILALEADLGFALGCWMPFSSAVPARNAWRILPGPYDVDTLALTVRGGWENRAPIGIYRGAGRPEAAMLMERLMDEAARELGIAPLDIRLRNFIPADALPLRRATGVTLDSGDYAALAVAAAEAADLPRLKADCEAARKEGAIKGVGMCCYIEPCGAGVESAAVSLHRGGRVIAETGATSQGQGRSTAAAQIIADALGLEPDSVEVRHGDTDGLGAGVGALASRSTPIGGSALQAAAEGLRAKACDIAAKLLQADAKHLVLVEDGFSLDDNLERYVGWGEIARYVEDNGAAAPLREEVVHAVSGEAWASGCCIAAVAIDADTGALTIDGLWLVDDAGVVINPMLAEGQFVGGMAQGVGEALMERIVYDSDDQLLTGSLMDYCVPRAGDMPPVSIVSRPVRSQMNTLGAKGAGEAGTVAVPPAILNAALDALAPLGVRHLDMPLTSERIWHAMRNARKSEKSQ